MEDPLSWEPFLGQTVVVDTDSHLLYIGTLAEVKPDFLVLRPVDVHDTHETPTTKEKYAMEARRLGVRPNRKEAVVRKALVVGLSKLDDVIVY